VRSACRSSARATLRRRTASRARACEATCSSRRPRSPVAGTAASMGLTMLPSAAPLPREATGHRHGHRRRAGELSAGPRHWCSAPATATKRASLTVAPCRCAAARTAARSARTTVSRRRGPAAWFSEQPAARAGRRPPPTPMEARSSCQDRHCAAAPATCSGARRGPGWPQWARARGRNRRAVEPAGRAGSPEPSPPSARPVSGAAHRSGAVRGSGAAITARAVSSSAGSSPGSRQATARTWRRISKWGSSTQIGPPQHPPRGSLKEIFATVCRAA
jgi:hypothetical protein